MDILIGLCVAGMWGSLAAFYFLARRNGQRMHKWSCSFPDCYVTYEAANLDMLIFLSDGHLEAAHDLKAYES